LLEVKVRRLRKSARLPFKATSGSSGFDLFADIDEPLEIRPLGRVQVGTGIVLEIPEGYEGEVRPRSGLSAKYGVTILNSPGTIDSDYRGEVKVILINLGNEPFTVEPGMRIAQLIIKKVESPAFVEVDMLSDTERGEGGFGHTGYL